MLECWTTANLLHTQVLDASLTELLIRKNSPKGWTKRGLKVTIFSVLTQTLFKIDQNVSSEGLASIAATRRTRSYSCQTAAQTRSVSSKTAKTKEQREIRIDRSTEFPPTNAICC